MGGANRRGLWGTRLYRFYLYRTAPIYGANVGRFICSYLRLFVCMRANVHRKVESRYKGL